MKHNILPVTDLAYRCGTCKGAWSLVNKVYPNREALTLENQECPGAPAEAPATPEQAPADPTPAPAEETETK